MAVIFQTTDITNTSVSNEIYSNTGTPSVAIASGDEVIVADDVFVGSGAGIVDLANATQFDLTFLGTGYSIGTALRLDLNTSQTDDFDFDYRVHIGPDASITSREALGFIGVLSTAAGVRDDGSKVEFVNDGTMASISNAGLSFQTIGVAAFTNNGTISSADTNNTVSFKNIGTAKLFNNGDIVSQNIGIGTFSAAINFSSSTGNSYFVNTGNVSSAGSAYYSSANASEILVNAGTITGQIDMSTVTDSELRNTGLIIGDVDTNFGNDMVINSGTIDGNFFSGGDDDTIVNTGVITGSLELGSGDDIYKAGGSGLVAGAINGADGNDTIFGGESDENIDGGLDDDLIRGNGGEDNISGGLGEDNVNGGNGDDTISGGDDGDVLRGGAGDDVITGDDGDDKLYGGAGADEITGGAGKDVMRGNGGADTFIFSSSTDADTGANADRIRDFEQGIDKIDISAIETFVFIGDSSFSGTGFEVRYQATATGLRFELDVDGDGNADMRINMNGISDLLESDFIL